MVKVLDFGLAKGWEDAGQSGPDMAESPTLTAQMTQAGVILGTAAYMSPEQAKGLDADKRADVWSFGVVLWEMLTGRRLFSGDSVSDTLAGVLRDEISTDALPSGVPESIRRLIARCLDRDPRNRLRDIGEARILLSTAAVSEDEAAPEVAPRRSRTAAVVPWAVALAAVVAAFFAWRISPTETSRAPQAMRFSVDAYHVGGAGVVVSPDGRQLAFRQSVGDFTGTLWVRPLDRFEPIEIPDSRNARIYFWSPDSREIAFVQGQELFAHDIASESTRSILKGEEPFAGG